MYILNGADVQPDTRDNLARLEEFLVTGPQQVQMLHRARLQNMLAEATNNSLAQVDKEGQEKRNRILQYRKRGACKKFELPGSGELISCIYWDGSFYITGTDIIKIVEYRMRQGGMAMTEVQQKKFEEGIFSDLRHLKPGAGSRLEESRSEFLEWLCRHGCIRTQKKQKVYTWGAVDFDRLVQEAKERLIRRAEEAQPSALNSFVTAAAAAIVPGHSHMTPNGMVGIQPHEAIFSEDIQRDFYGTQSSLISEIDAISENKPGTASPSMSHTSGSTAEFLDLADLNVHLFGPEATMAPLAAIDDRSLCDNLQQTMQIISQYQPPTDLLSGLHPAGQTGALGLQPIMPAGVARLLPFQPSGLARGGRREDDRRFECNYQFCKRRFKRLEHLKRHVRIHTGERPFTCPVATCGRAFSRSDNLSQHLKIHMSGEMSAATTRSIGIFQALSQQAQQPPSGSTGELAVQHADNFQI